MKSISIIVPAHNEENYLPNCLEGIRLASNCVNIPVETIVVLNRCTDKTEQIAREFGAKIAHEDAKNLSLIRNAGAAIATGDILITIDADTTMRAGSLQEVLAKLSTGKFVGGGSMVYPDRFSLGIGMSLLAVMPYLIFHGVSFCMFWCLRRDFEAIGGFNPEFVSIEDLDFAKRLKAYGKKSGKRFGTVWKNPVITSTRKFDEFGDWYLFKNPGFIRKIFKGTDQKAANSFWYDVRS